MAENIIGQGLTTLYRGQPMFGPSRYLQLANQGTPTIMGGASQNLTTNQLSKLAGQYYTTDLSLAEKYAGKTGKILSTEIPSNYVNESGRFNRFQNRVTGLPSGNYTNAGVSGNAYLVPKSTLKNYPSKINIGKTISNYLGNTKLGETYRMLEPAMGDDYTKFEKATQFGKNVGNMGLGFLKQNAFRTLAMLGTLPAQAGLATLSPTRMGNAELRQMPQGSPTQINNGGGGGGRDPNQGNTQTGFGRSGMGRDPNDRMAMGGLINLYRNGGFI